jgi:hypothetical protein
MAQYGWMMNHWQNLPKHKRGVVCPKNLDHH